LPPSADIPSGQPDNALLVVDAANVVGSRPDQWWRERAGAARRLVDALAEALADASGTPDGDDLTGDVVVVLEGAARAGVAPYTSGRLRVVHAEGSGDDEIVAVVADAREERRDVTVVTSDRELRRRVEALGAHTHGPSRLLRRIDR
jgi:predicted RNA-binding protein with PIN domain